MMGVQLLSQLVCEMNQISEADASRSLTKHRKIASSFRDTQLFEIFQLSSTLLRTGQSEHFENIKRNKDYQVRICRYLLLIHSKKIYSNPIPT